MCKLLKLIRNSKLPEPVVIATTPYKEGGKIGDLPSMRVDIAAEDITYDLVNTTLTIRNILPRVTIETVQNTNSMEPMLDIGHTVVLSNHPKYMDDLKEGDVVIANVGRGRIIHAIVKIDEDEEGWFCIIQGWNLKNPDPYKVRRDQITSTVLMVIPTKEFYGFKPAGGSHD